MVGNVVYVRNNTRDWWEQNDNIGRYGLSHAGCASYASYQPKPKRSFFFCICLRECIVVGCAQQALASAVHR